MQTNLGCCDPARGLQTAAVMSRRTLRVSYFCSIVGMLLVACSAAEQASLDPGGKACAGTCGAALDAGLMLPSPRHPVGFVEGERHDSGAVDAAVDASPEAGSACDPTALCATGELEALAPRVLLLVDRSGSMTYAFSAGATRWQALSQVLTEPDVGVIGRFERDVEFALAFYTYRGEASASCAVLSDVFQADYQAAFLEHPPLLDGQTPTAEALEQAGALLRAPFPGASTDAGTPDAGAPSDSGSADGAAELDGAPATGAKQVPSAIILATDGMPDSCLEQKVDTEGSAAAQRAIAAQVVERARSLYDDGIRTYVVGVGAALQREHLQALANAGIGYDPLAGNGQPGTVYQAGDSAALRAAFDDHMATLRSCGFPLDRPVSDPALAEVSLDGRALEWGKDWLLDGEDSVRLIGDACEQLKRSGGHVRAQVPCGCE